ncbi:MAG: hypothetical protein LBS23_02745 [Holosporaceae bacterium]|jgi:hypothetical protein|nr:hypothetical protein [Holosporaceae bacterium]
MRDFFIRLLKIISVIVLAILAIELTGNRAVAIRLAVNGCNDVVQFVTDAKMFIRHTISTFF